jgi:hypothetical protein
MAPESMHEIGAVILSQTNVPTRFVHDGNELFRFGKVTDASPFAGIAIQNS